jgi:hypothetical protein
MPGFFVLLGDTWHVRAFSSNTKCGVVYDSSWNPIFMNMQPNNGMPHVCDSCRGMVKTASTYVTE